MLYPEFMFIGFIFEVLSTSIYVPIHKNNIRFATDHMS